MGLDMSPGIYHGALVEVVEAEGTGLVGDHAAGATVLTVAAGGFRTQGQCRVLGDVYDYVRIGDALTITPALLVAAEDGTPVESLTAGEPDTQKKAIVDLDMLGEEGETVDETEDLPRAWVPGEWAGYYPIGTYPSGTFIDVEDAPYGYRVKGRPHGAPQLNGAAVDASTLDVTALPPIPITDGDAPTAATTVTPIGGIGSMFYRWTEVANADPVTYRLHVRAGSAPTTTGTYEVAAGVGLTSASVRKLADGTAIVGDGSVTYHAIVTVEDADGPGPASADVTGVPAQITSPDIATGAVTTDTLVFNSGWGTELNGETVTGVTITGSTVTGLSSLFAGPAGDPRVMIRPVVLDVLDEPGIVFDPFGNDTSDIPVHMASGVANGGSLTITAGRQSAGGLLPRYQVSRAGGLVPPHMFSDGDVRVDDSLEVVGTLTAGTFNATGGSVGTGTFRTSVDARVSAVAPTVTMTTGGVGTGAFRTSVDARADARIAATIPLGAWTTYPPTFTAATTNPTLANFTRAGRYIQIGKLVHFSIVITCNASTGLGSGNYRFGLPVAARDENECVFRGDQDAPIRTYTSHKITGNTTEFNLCLTSDFSLANPTQTGMASGTVIRITGTYEAA